MGHPLPECRGIAPFLNCRWFSSTIVGCWEIADNFLNFGVFLTHWRRDSKCNWKSFRATFKLIWYSESNAAILFMVRSLIVKNRWKRLWFWPNYIGHLYAADWTQWYVSHLQSHVRLSWTEEIYKIERFIGPGGRQGGEANWEPDSK